MMTRGITSGRNPALRRLSMVGVSLCVWMALISSGQCRAGSDPESGRPKLMVLYTARSADDGPEQRFVTEVTLAIDQYQVVPVRLQEPEFMRWSFERQRETLVALNRAHRATYFIWVTYSASGSATLFMCTLLPQRTFLRTVEVPSGPGVEKELAIAARELAEEINFTVSPYVPPPPTPTSIPKKGTAFQSTFELMLSARGTFGIVGHEGPANLPGAGVGFKWWFSPRFNLKVETALDFGPYRNTRETSLSGLTVSPGLGLEYRKKWGAVSLGPLIEFQESWTRLKAAAFGNASQTYTWWHFRVAAGLTLGVTAKRSTVAIDGSIGLSPVQETIRRESDGAAVLVTPLVDFRLSMSVLFSL